MFNRIFLTIFLISLSKFSGADTLTQPPQNEATLCSEDEDIYFSCPLDDGKIVSVCAKNNTTPNHGYVRYRYGIESDIFEYPRENIPPRGHFVISDVSEGTIRGLHLKFSIGKFTYVVSSVWPGEIYVSKNNKIVFDKQCQASRYKSFSNDIFNGIEQAPPSKVDIH